MAEVVDDDDSRLQRLVRSFLASLKFDPLSECSSIGSPLRATNRRRQARKASVVKSRAAKLDQAPQVKL